MVKFYLAFIQDSRKSSSLVIESSSSSWIICKCLNLTRPKKEQFIWHQYNRMDTWKLKMKTRQINHTIPLSPSHQGGSWYLRSGTWGFCFRIWRCWNQCYHVCIRFQDWGSTKQTQGNAYEYQGKVWTKRYVGVIYCSMKYMCSISNLPNQHLKGSYNEECLPVKAKDDYLSSFV